MQQLNVQDNQVVDWNFYSYSPTKIHEQIVTMEDEYVKDWTRKNKTMLQRDDDRVDVILVSH